MSRTIFACSRTIAPRTSANPPSSLALIARSIFKLTASYKADSFKNKVNLGVGAYRDNDGKPWVLPSVKQVSVTSGKKKWLARNLGERRADKCCACQIRLIFSSCRPRARLSPTSQWTTNTSPSPVSPTSPLPPLN